MSKTEKFTEPRTSREALTADDAAYVSGLAAGLQDYRLAAVAAKIEAALRVTPPASAPEAQRIQRETLERLGRIAQHNLPDPLSRAASPAPKDPLAPSPVEGETPRDTAKSWTPERIEREVERLRPLAAAEVDGETPAVDPVPSETQRAGKETT